MLKLLCLLLTIHQLHAYDSWILGNKADFKLPDESVLDGGVLIAGGSTDQDAAMIWFLNKARGGDVLVFRNGRNASVLEYPTADAYNPYLYSQLRVTVDSVETIFLNSREVAHDAEVVQKVKNAEAIFFTGGDQAFYWYNIENTPLQDAFNYAINVKRVVIGGTSAGNAIMGQFIFSAENDTVTSVEALNNPYNNKVAIRNDLFDIPLLKNTITDSHYNNPDRRGRHITFMARILTDNPTKVTRVRGIGVEEKTVVALDTATGKAYVFGTGSAHFIQQYRQNVFPERCVPGASLDWNSNRQALETYKIPGNKFGDRFFDMNTWRSGSGGTWSFYYVSNGLFGVA
jgi:cyanophycinase